MKKRFINEQKRDFKGVWIPKEIWLDKQLSWIEKLFLTEINSLDNDKGCFAGNKYFAGFFLLSEHRCSQIINSLIKKKYIKAEYERKGKQIVRRVLNICQEGIKNMSRTLLNKCQEPYLENVKDNNTLSNNTLIKDIVTYLNLKANKNYKADSKKTIGFIKARINDGFRLDDFKKVIDNKSSQWLNNSKMDMYLRPETLFGTKFEGYLNEKFNNNDIEIAGV